MICVNINAFRLIGNRHIPFKAKVTLILCVFSSSDVGSKWQLLYSLLHPTTKHLNRLIRDILSSLPRRRTPLSSLRAGLKGVAHRMRSAARVASRHVFQIRTHCFLCVYAHRRRHSASVRSAQQRLRTLFKFLPRHRAPSALFYIK